jgi:fumarate reductase subunit D
MLWIGWVLWFGVIDSGITINYLLLPITLMLVAIAVDLAAILRHNIDRNRAAGRAVSVIASTLVIAAIAADQWRGEGPFSARLEAARPTINVPGIDEIR